MLAEKKRKTEPMLSYRTILAIQALSVLGQEERFGITITDLKVKTGIKDTKIGWVVRELIRYGWLTSDSRNRHSMTDYARRSTLYDLVVVMDGDVVMGPNINTDYVPLWNKALLKPLSHAVELNEALRDEFTAILKATGIMELITDPGAAAERTSSPAATRIHPQNGAEKARGDSYTSRESSKSKTKMPMTEMRN